MADDCRDAVQPDMRGRVLVPALAYGLAVLAQLLFFPAIGLSLVLLDSHPKRTVLTGLLPPRGFRARRLRPWAGARQ